jgi:hypothetical protein
VTRTALAALVLVAGAATLGEPLHAAAAAPVCTDQWINGFGGNFADPTNWSTGSVPGTTDVACINLSGDYTIALTQQISVGRLLMTAPSGTQWLDIETAAPPFGESDPVAVASLTTTDTAGRSVIGPHAAVMLERGGETPGSEADIITHGPLDNMGTITVYPVGANGAHLRARGGQWTNEGSIVVDGATTFQGGHRLRNQGSITGNRWLDVKGIRTRMSNDAGKVAIRVRMARPTRFGQGDGTTRYVETSGTVEFTGKGAATVVATSGATIVGNTVGGQRVEDEATIAAEPVTWQAPATVGGSLTAGYLDVAAGASPTDAVVIAPGGHFSGTSLFGSGWSVTGNFVNQGTALLKGTLEDSTFMNNGAATLQSFTVASGARFVNGANGSTTTPDIITVQGEWVQGSGSNTGFVAMSGSGSILRLRGSGPGSFQFVSGGKIVGDVAAGQTIYVLSGNAADDVVRTAGALTNAGTLYFGSGTHNALLDVGGAGVLTNAGTITTTGGHGRQAGIRTGSLTNAGSIVATGGLSVAAGQGFTQTAGGHLSLQVAGGASSYVQTTGPATLGGGLNLDTVSPDSTGVPLTLVHAQSVSGTFDSVTSPGAAYNVTYGATAVTASPA